MTPKVFIAGTGRAGTSFLTRFLTRLGLDTGFTATADGFVPKIRAGCELGWGVQDQTITPPSIAWLASTPRILKSPYLSLHIAALAEAGAQIEHVIVPVRSLDDATHSRLNAGLAWHSTDFAQERAFLASVLARVTGDCTRLGIPFTVLEFPQHVTDVAYSHGTLSQALPELAAIDYAVFCRVFEQLNREHAELRR